ncbi:hypothetical protein Hanom_Chr14g01265781 [Helianthus anomalus]
MCCSSFLKKTQFNFIQNLVFFPGDFEDNHSIRALISVSIIQKSSIVEEITSIHVRNSLISFL